MYIINPTFKAHNLYIHKNSVFIFDNTSKKINLTVLGKYL